jgi:UDP-N-acetylglucosamine 2-epimerase
MLDQVLQLFAIRPQVDLNLMQPNQSLSGLTAALFDALDRVVKERRPDWILAQGDTTSVMVAGLVSFYHGIRFGHVEAGLRTHDKHHPFPEEINRCVADLVADAHFAPTERARQTLLAEGRDARKIHLTGNTVVDALLDVAGKPFDWAASPVAAIPLDKRLVLITAHRRESFGEPFRQLCLAIKELASNFHDKHAHFLYPVHLNPNVRKPVMEILNGHHNITLLEPLDYFTLVHVMKRSYVALTDSGGIQEEAPSFGVPVLVMRNATERPEGIEAGVSKLVGTDRASIVRETARLLDDPAAHRAMATPQNPYGDGHAAERIVAALLGKVVS